MVFPLLSFKGFTTQIGRSLFLSLQNERVPDQFVDASNFHSRNPILQQRRKGGLVNGTDTGQ
jgi:hypothetical protein